MFKKRIISSALLISVITGTIFIDWLCSALVIFFIIAGLYEFFTMLEHKGIRIYKYFGIGMGIIIPFSIMFRFEPTKGWELLFIVLALVFLILMQFRRRKNQGVIVDISTTLFGILYVSWFFSFLIKIRYLSGGIGLLSTVLLITKLGDIGAYLVGVRFGKTPLMPHISPKKSVEGSIGGLVFSIAGALISKGFLHFNYLHLIFLGVFLGILGQLGDLSESLIKRDCEVKDSGQIFPGLGGVLDSIDSLLFTAPAFYFYISNTPR
ncbi:MAG: phosphatidate cytidylyltransferase [Candidatus Omnitrophica bacterium]|nr:phosphatidate cytidylyltransferase [Candidatus Omnitrophota bacterium]